MAGHSALRLGADIAVAGFALLTGVLTARALGPPGKGALSTLSYLVALAWPMASLGVGEATIASVHGRTEDLNHVSGTAITLALVGTAVLGVMVLLVSGVPAFGVADIEKGRAAAAVAVVPTTLAIVLAVLAEARGHFVLTSVARITGAATTFAMTLVLVTGRDLAVFGALAAVAVGPAAATFLLAIGFRQQRMALRPRWDRQTARTVLRLGVPVQLGLVLAVAVARLDLLVVAAFRDKVDVGLYSVALSVSQLVSLAPVAVSAAVFPRIARSTIDQGSALLGKAVRAGALSGVALGAIMAMTTPFLLPVIFGHGFRDAVVPAIVLLPGSLVHGLQWIVARSVAARGVTSALPRTFGSSLVVMLASDLVLIPYLGLVGAAAGTAFGMTIGLAVAVRDAHACGLRLGSERSTG